MMRGNDIKSAPTVIGRRTTLSTQPGTGGLIVSGPTQLISARTGSPKQWLITLMQPTTSRSGINPWGSTFDGGAFPPVPPAIFTAPVLPDQAQGMQVRLRWGAGGVAFETAFDYPAAGGAFGLTAEYVDLNVGFKAPVVAPYATADLVPIVGAFMVPGSAADPSPLRWLDVPGNLTTSALATRSWAVKPFARSVRLSFAGAMAPVGTIPDIQVAFLDTNNASLWLQNYDVIAGQTGLILDVEVPRQATVMSLTHNGAPVIGVVVEWVIGLT